MARRPREPNLSHEAGTTLQVSVQKVFVAIPCQDQCNSWFAYDLARLVGYSVAQGVGVSMGILKTAFLPSSRNQLAEMGLKSKAGHILWLDSDMRFPKDALVRLLKHREPIVAAGYSMRRMPLGPVTYKGFDQSEPIFIPNDASGLIQVGMCGMGVMLTETRVFETMPRPWFEAPWSEHYKDFIGEDVHFCRGAHQQGFKVMVDCDLTHEVGHLGEWEFSNQQLLSYRDQVAQAEATASANAS